MKLLTFSLFASVALAAEQHPIVTKTTSVCPSSAPSGVIYVPPGPAEKCFDLKVGDVEYQYYGKSCVASPPIAVYLDKGAPYNDLTSYKDVCKAARRCANLAGNATKPGAGGPGVDGGGPDYAFAVAYNYPYPPEQGSWQCWGFYGQGNYPPAGTQPGFSEDVPGPTYAWYQIEPYGVDD